MNASIKIYSRQIKSPFLLPNHPQHLFIIYESSKEEKIILRGGLESNNVFNMVRDDLKIVMCPYDKSKYISAFKDDDTQGNPSIPIANGSDEEMQVYMARMWSVAQKINMANLDYKFPTFACAFDLCHVQNSNTVIRILVERSGLTFKLPEINDKPVNAPGISGELKNTLLDIAIQKNRDSLTEAAQNECMTKKSDLPIDLNSEEDFHLNKDFINFNWEESCPSFGENSANKKNNIKEVDNSYPDVFNVLDMFSDPEVRDPTLTNSDRFRLLAKKQEGGKYSELSGMFENLAVQTDFVLSFLGSSEASQKSEES